MLNFGYPTTYEAVIFALVGFDIIITEGLLDA